MIEKYGSLDRFYPGTDFSKGHLPQILRGKRSPPLPTIVKLARALDVSVPTSSAQIRNLIQVDNRAALGSVDEVVSRTSACPKLSGNMLAG